jgi:predicted secreted protein
MFKKSILAAALVAASMSAALPAAAQNALSLTLNATNAEEANAIRSGLTLFSLVQGAQSGAFVNQNGSLNGGAIAQVANGGSVGVIHQDGNGHNATLDQQGTNQAHGIFQFGNGADANVVQTANGQAGLTFQFGLD